MTENLNPTSDVFNFDIVMLEGVSFSNLEKEEPRERKMRRKSKGQCFTGRTKRRRLKGEATILSPQTSGAPGMYTEEEDQGAVFYREEEERKAIFYREEEDQGAVFYREEEEEQDALFTRDEEEEQEAVFYRDEEDAFYREEEEQEAAFCREEEKQDIMFNREEEEEQERMFTGEEEREHDAVFYREDEDEEVVFYRKEQEEENTGAPYSWEFSMHISHSLKCMGGSTVHSSGSTNPDDLVKSIVKLLIQ
uniref:Uncharacterized protein n=1 Tax=Oryza punctata TaxID=4537 RepID=A0A0E0MHY4_ORYPU